MERRPLYQQEIRWMDLVECERVFQRPKKTA